MKKNLKALLVLSMALPLAACGSKPVTPEPVLPPIQKIQLSYSGNYKSDDNYSTKIYYSDKAFIENKASKMNVQLMEQSMALALAATPNIKSKDYQEYDKNFYQFYEAAGFSNIEICEEYNQKPSEDSLGYGFASKTLSDGNPLIALGIRGSGYEAEWADNVLLGEEGDHEGFAKWAEELVKEIKDYALDHSFDLAKTKLWISGYSRGAAISNLIGTYLDDEIDANTLSMDKDNIFVYTFEAPNCAIKDEDNDNYTNIINVINTNDLIPYIAPRAYGFARNGQEYNINKFITTEQLLVQYTSINPDVEYQEFTPGTFGEEEGIKNKTAEEYWDYFVNEFLTSKDEEKPELADISTRENFVDNIQDSLVYLVGTVTSLSNDQLTQLGDYFKNNIFGVLAILGADKDSLYSFMKGALENVGAAYDDTDLHTNCDKIQKVIYGYMQRSQYYPMENVMLTYGNASYIVYNHAPETSLAYVLALYQQK